MDSATARRGSSCWQPRQQGVYHLEAVETRASASAAKDKQGELSTDNVTCLAEMQTISNKVHQQYVNAMSAYKKCHQHLPVTEACCGSATCPALADMLEWLLDLDYMFQYLYENQQEVFDTIDYSQEAKMQSLLTRWTSGHNEVAESVENVLAHVSFFMADG
ncbi:AFG2-interacting ribosome maturation factor-like isoform X2 [Diadema setosum]|uniref:AFG2-interacting ribosome maturation factor-like isoform X2 n=1 Tax=Diadema setosum TaxID=31175 RepID=UPI003B3BB1CC